MKTKFTLYSGLNTIGGVVFSVEYGQDRVIMEMGSAYNPSTDVYDGVVIPRSKAWVRDAIRTQRIPAIDGIYRKQDLEGFMGLIPAEDSPYNTAIFITHLHLDHMAGIGFVAPEIPIFMNENAILIEKALEATGEGVETLEREYTHFAEDQPIRVGAIEVQPFLTSRRSYRDFAFLITTPDGTIHNTGDLSLHNAEAQLNWDQMEFLKAKEIDVLLCDTTAFMDEVLLQINDTTDPKAIIPGREIPAGMLSGDDVERELFKVLESQKGLTVFNFYQREMDEAQRFINWASQVERTCVFEPDCAYILYKFYGMQPNVFIPDSRRYPDDPAAQPEWFRELLANSRIITREEIHNNPSGYLLQNSYRHILELFDLPGEDGAYLHADGIPIGAFDPAYQNLLRIVGRTKFEYVTFFCKNYFGHGYPQQIKYFVDQVDPKVLIPCHGFNPERLLPNNGLQLLPELGKTYILSDGQLILEDEYAQ
jgi:ribonuclease J